MEEGCEVMIIDRENLSITSRGFGRSVSVLSALRILARIITVENGIENGVTTVNTASLLLL